MTLCKVGVCVGEDPGHHGHVQAGIPSVMGMHEVEGNLGVVGVCVKVCPL